jgi:hypothetical protein
MTTTGRLGRFRGCAGKVCQEMMGIVAVAEMVGGGMREVRIEEVIRE